MGQKWGKPYANLCHPMAIMHICILLWTSAKDRSHRPSPQKLPHTPTQSGRALSDTLGSWLRKTLLNVHGVVTDQEYNATYVITSVTRTLLYALECQLISAASSAR